MDNRKEHKQDEPVDQKRRVVARAGVLTPLVMSLVNKTALGQGVYHCSVSGAQSGNVSSHPNNTISCNVGYSINSWKNNADQTSGNGNISDWLNAGIIPFDIVQPDKIIKGTNASPTQNAAIYNAINGSGLGGSAASFDVVFGTSGVGTFWDALASGGTTEADAAADYLNVKIHQFDGRFSPVYDSIALPDIVNLYQLAAGIITQFTTSSGVVVSDAAFAANYLQLIKQ
jgi:hypothetical protein